VDSTRDQLVDAPRQRLRFDDLSLDTAPDGHCRVEVRLEWRGHHYQTSATGLNTHEGRLRAVAEATLDAQRHSVETVALELSGVKAVRAFDGWVVIVRVNATAEGRPYRLLGSAACEAEDQVPWCAARAVLDATNRLMERHLAV
jgi:hypothetical protein